MLLFPVFAALVCYVCYRWRRSLAGALALLGSVVVVVTLAMLDRAVREWFVLGDSFMTNLQWLLWVEAGAIFALGAFFYCVPRHRAQLPCRGCGYDLHGLEHDNPTCPECGLGLAARRARRMKCPRCGVRSMMDPIRPRCAHCQGTEQPLPAAS